MSVVVAGPSSILHQSLVRVLIQVLQGPQTTTTTGNLGLGGLERPVKL